MTVIHESGILYFTSNQATFIKLNNYKNHDYYNDLNVKLRRIDFIDPFYDLTLLNGGFMVTTKENGYFIWDAYYDQLDTNYLLLDENLPIINNMSKTIHKLLDNQEVLIKSLISLIK